MSLLLLDTRLLLWPSAAEERLPASVHGRVADAGDTPAFSVVSLWEVVSEAARLMKELGIEPRLLGEEWLCAGYREIAVAGERVIAAARLHKDAVGRLLTAQAAVEGATLPTSDPAMGRYGQPGELVRRTASSARRLGQRGGMRSTWPG